MSNVLVTGANGFVGGALHRTLEDRGHWARGAVRSKEAEASAGRELCVVGDIGPNTQWAAALENIDSVVHLAARVHVMNEEAEDPLAEFRRVNVAGTERLAREAAANGVRRMVYVSSVKVNGERTSGVPFTEEDPPRPGDSYAISKWEAEQSLRCVASETGLEAVILRPPLVYGPGVKANFLELLKLVNSGLPLPLRSADNRRSLIYVSNLAGAIVECLERTEAAGETFLVSDGEDLSIPELVRLVAHALGKPPRLLPCPPAVLRAAGRASGRPETVDRLLESLEVDSGRVRSSLEWSPPYTTEEGLIETARWFEGFGKASGGA